MVFFSFISPYFPPLCISLLPPPSLSFLLSLLREALISCSQDWTGTLLVAEGYLELLILLLYPSAGVTVVHNTEEQTQGFINAMPTL